MSAEAPPSDGAVGRRPLLERWLALRDGLLASPRFQRFAAAFPLTRPLARARARALFDLVAGFVYSQTLFACVQLGAFDALAAGPLDRRALGARIGLGPEACDRLVDAAAALRLFKKLPGGRVALGDLGAALRGAPGVEAMVRHHALLYADLADPAALLRGEVGATATGAFWGYAGGAERPSALDGAHTDSYSALMAATQPFVAEETLDAFAFRGRRSLLDLGGGHGVFAEAAAKRRPKMAVTVFDLPAVAARAQERFDRAGLSPRVRAVGGSFFDDALPTGADAVSLVRVLYDHPDDQAARILRAAYAALPPGGTVVVAEPMADAPGAAPVSDCYYGFYLLAMKGGRSRTAAEIAGLLAGAGFENARPRRTRRPLLAQVVVARRPR